MAITKTAVNSALNSLTYFRNHYHEGHASGFDKTRLLKKVIARRTESGVEIYSAAYEEAMPEWVYCGVGYDATDDILAWMREELNREDVVAAIQAGLNEE